MSKIDWNSYHKAHGISPDELSKIGQQAGATNATEAIQAANDAWAKRYSPEAFGRAFFGNNYTCADTAGLDNSGINGLDRSKLRATGDPEQDAKNFAKQMGISVEEAKSQLRAMFGDPQQRT